MLRLPVARGIRVASRIRRKQTAYPFVALHHGSPRSASTIAGTPTRQRRANNTSGQDWPQAVSWSLPGRRLQIAALAGRSSTRRPATALRYRERQSTAFSVGGIESASDIPSTPRERRARSWRRQSVHGVSIGRWSPTILRPEQKLRWGFGARVDARCGIGVSPDRST